MENRATAMADALSDRERQLVVLASKGLTDTAIAHKLGISLATVGTYWGRVRVKFGPLNRTELVAVFLREHSAAIVEALKAENQTLQRQLEDKSRNEEMLKTSVDFFRSLVDSASSAIVVVGEDGQIQMANEHGAALFRYEPSELVGKSIEALVPERYHHAHLENRALYNSNPVKRRMGEHLATYALRKDGSEFPIATSLSATETAHGLIVTCLCQDLTETLNAFTKAN